jgi:cbb3-type cytochrome oxidase maturation protein
MTSLAWLIPVTLLLGGLWALRAGQFKDLEGASYRALEDDPPDEPPQ